MIDGSSKILIGGRAILTVQTLHNLRPVALLDGMWLHHDWPHHLVVFMGKNVAVINEPWVLHQALLFNREEILACGFLLSYSELFVGHVRFGPSNPDDPDFVCWSEGSLLVAFLVFRQVIRFSRTNVFVLRIFAVWVTSAQIFIDLFVDCMIGIVGIDLLHDIQA